MSRRRGIIFWAFALSVVIFPAVTFNVLGWGFGTFYLWSWYVVAIFFSRPIGNWLWPPVPWALDARTLQFVREMLVRRQVGWGGPVNRELAAVDQQIAAVAEMVRAGYTTPDAVYDEYAKRFLGEDR